MEVGEDPRRGKFGTIYAFLHSLMKNDRDWLDNPPRGGEIL